MRRHDKSNISKSASLDEKIRNLTHIQESIKKMEKRKQDEDFNYLRQTAYDYVGYKINDLKNIFDEL